MWPNGCLRVPVREINDPPEVLCLLPHLEIMTLWTLGTQYIENNKIPMVPRSCRNGTSVHPMAPLKDLDIESDELRILSDSKIPGLCWPY